MWVLAEYEDLEVETQSDQKCFLTEGKLHGKNIKDHYMGKLQSLLEQEGASKLVYHVTFDIITQSSLEKWRNSENIKYSYL